MPNVTLDFDRIEYLFDVKALAESLVTVVGLGSGGAPVCDHLTMNGVRRWHLYDPDVLEPENLVKHPRCRRDLGRPKVDIQKEWILDRNPSAEVSAFAADALTASTFAGSLASSKLVLIAVDKQTTRERISDACVQLRVPFVVASVFRTGLGGEVYAYIPGETGCYRCLELYASSSGIDLPDEALGLTDDEERRIYGLGQEEYRASGLSLDIQSVSLLQARMALNLLLPPGARRFPSMRANWIIWANRPSPGIFAKHFEAKQMRLAPQAECFCHAQSGM